MNISQDFVQELTLIFLLAFMSFIASMLLTPIYTFFAYKYKLWKVPRTNAVTGEAAPIYAQLHAAKHRRNIPTMAFIVSVVVVSVVTLFFNVSNATLLLLAAMLGGGIVGLIDDIINVRGLGGGIKGLRSSLKFFMIIAVAAMCGWFFYYQLGYHTIHLPFPPYDLDLGWWLVPVFTFVVVATGNAVNISDGLDGLAGGLSATAFGVFGIIALLQGQTAVAGFCFTMVGTLLAYLWFNIYPARFFMTDVGSFAIGTSLGVVAMLTNTLFLLPIIGFMFVLEAGSSLIQIFSKKVFKRKIFISAPMHHHFEALGWHETKVTMRFWVIGQIFGAIGLILALAGGYI